MTHDETNPAQIESQDTTIASIATGAALRITLIGDYPRILKRYVDLLKNIIHHAAILDRLFTEHAERLQQISDTYNIARVYGSNYIVANNQATEFDILESTLMGSPLPSTDIDAILQR